MPDPGVNEKPLRTYDDARCIVCGTPWEDHSPDCARHEFAPSWARFVYVRREEEERARTLLQYGQK